MYVSITASTIYKLAFNFSNSQFRAFFENYRIMAARPMSQLDFSTNKSSSSLTSSPPMPFLSSFQPHEMSEYLQTTMKMEYRSDIRHLETPPTPADSSLSLLPTGFAMPYLPTLQLDEKKEYLAFLRYNHQRNSQNSEVSPWAKPLWPKSPLCLLMDQNLDFDLLGPFFNKTRGVDVLYLWDGTFKPSALFSFVLYSFALLMVSEYIKKRPKLSNLLLESRDVPRKLSLVMVYPFWRRIRLN